MRTEMTCPTPLGKTGTLRAPGVPVDTAQITQGPANLESNELLLPGVKSRQVDLLQGLVAEPQVDAVGGDGELEGHGLVGFCHVGELLGGRREGSRGTSDQRSQKCNVFGIKVFLPM